MSQTWCPEEYRYSNPDCLGYVPGPLEYAVTHVLAFLVVLGVVAAFAVVLSLTRRRRRAR